MQKRNWESMNFVQTGMFCLQRQLFVHSSADRNSTKKTDSKFKLQSHHTIFGCEIRSLRCWRQCGGIRCHIWQRIVVAIYLSSPKRWSHFKHHFFWRIFHQTRIPSKTNLSGQPRRLCEPRCNTPRLARVDRHGDLEGWATHLPCGFRWSRPLTSPQRKKGHGKVETKRTASHLRVSCPNRSTGSWYQQIFRIESESHPLKRNKHVLHLWVSLCKFVLNS